MPFKASFASETTNEKEFVQLLTTGIEAATDSVNRYEKMAALAEIAEIKNLFFDLAREERAHAEKLRALLLLAKEEKEHREKLRALLSKEGKGLEKATVKPFEEQGEAKPPRPAVEAEQPQQIPPAAKGAVKFQEEPRPAKPIKPAKEPRSANGAAKPKGEKPGGEVHVCTVCGYKAYGPAPNRCPVCGAPKDAFK